MPQLLLEHLFTTLPNVRMTHVPFPGAAQALTATMSSQTELAVVTLPPAVPLVDLRQAQGHRGDDAARARRRCRRCRPWPRPAIRACRRRCGPAFFVPAKTPKAIADKLGDAVLKVAAMPDIRRS